MDDGPTRLTFYFLLVNIFLFSIAIHSIVNNKVKFTAKILFIVFCFIYFLNYLLSGAGGLYPYFFDEQFIFFFIISKFFLIGTTASNLYLFRKDFIISFV